MDGKTLVEVPEEIEQARQAAMSNAAAEAASEKVRRAEGMAESAERRGGCGGSRAKGGGRRRRGAKDAIEGAKDRERVRDDLAAAPPCANVTPRSKPREQHHQRRMTRGKPLHPPDPLASAEAARAAENNAATAAAMLPPPPTASTFLRGTGSLRDGGGDAQSSRPARCSSWRIRRRADRCQAS